MSAQSERISSSELTTLITVFLIGSAVIMPKGASAGHDSWLAVLLATAIGLGIAWLYVQLTRADPQLSLVKLGQQLLGTWGGKLIGILYAWYAFHLGTLVLKNLEELTVTVLLPHTPPLMIDTSLMVLVIWVVYEGVEVIARSSLVILGVFTLFTLISLALQFQDFEWGHLLPLLDHGWAPFTQSAIRVTTFPYGEIILFAMILPFLNQPGETKKSMFSAVLIGGFFLFLDDLRNVLIFSELNANVHFPSYTAIAFISVTDFLERIEPFGYLMWAFSGFIKISVCLLACLLCLAQTLGLQHYRPLILPVAILMIELSQFIYRSQAEMITFANDVWPWYSLPFQVLIPLLLLLLYRFKRKKETKKDLIP